MAVEWFEKSDYLTPKKQRIYIRYVNETKDTWGADNKGDYVRKRTNGKIEYVEYCGERVDEFAHITDAINSICDLVNTEILNR
ncbi:hypothetical protein QB910_000134 [Dabrowskivirus KKP3916]|uniref:Uncharacterized protein n=1 Tax=Alicyclobacillus phage KKP_3916 TaxID=3040651 RepID=A0AAT9V7R1_9CAUD|nr:hypothetical protein QB910_000134 [Alicyclobacillus phage KKP 3916]